MSNETEMITLQPAINEDEWRPRLSTVELDAKYGPPVAPLVIDQRIIDQREDLPEIAAEEGQTYIALYPDLETASKIWNWCLDIGVPRPVPRHNLHVTMFKLNRPTQGVWQVGKIKPIVVPPTNLQTEVILQSDRNLFVLNMSNKKMIERRENMSKRLNGRMQNPASFHMTLSYNIGRWRDKTHHAINFDLIFVEEKDREPRI